MFCERCGKQLDDGTKFCVYCGAAVVTADESAPAAAPTEAPVPQPVAQPAPPAAPSATAVKVKNLLADKKKLGILIGAAAALVAILVLVIVLVAMPKTIVLDDYITVTFDGLDTRGTATLDVDWDTMMTDIYDKAGKKHQSDIYYALWMYGGMDIDLSAYDGLSNGDEIYVMYQLDEEMFKQYNIRFKLKNPTIKVEGLQEPIYLDLFEDLEVTFEGCAPYSIASVTCNSENTFIQENVEFYINDGYDLSEGDEFTVVASFSEYTAEENGYIIETSEKVYTAENLPQPTELNVFDYVEVTFTGMEGDGYANYTVTSDIDYINYLSFSFDVRYDLSAGDVVTLTCNTGWYGDPLQYGYTLTATEQTYTVPTLDHYISSFTDLSVTSQTALTDAAGEYAKTYFDSTAEDCRTDYISIDGVNYWDRSLGYAETVSNAELIYVADGTFTSWYSDYYYIYFVYSFEATGHTALAEGETTTLYGYVYASQPIELADGTIDTDSLNFSYGSYCYQSYEDLYENVLAEGSDVVVTAIN